MMVPSLKNLPQVGDFPTGAHPSDVDHFTCYDVTVAGTMPSATALLSDQFYNDTSRPEKLGPERMLRVNTPKWLCNPAAKAGPVPGAQPQAPAPFQAHLLCYGVQPLNGTNQSVPGLYLENQLGPQRLNLGVVRELCVPSLKLAPAPLP
jgi:hypothetical protein